MRVLFQSRKTLFDAPGGDTIQLLKTKKYLEKLGVEVHVSTELTPDVSTFDLVHVFNLMRAQESLLQVKNAKEYGKPVALSTIYGLYTDFEKRGRGGIASKLFKYLGPFQIEYVKTFARTFIGKELHMGSISTLLRGIYSTMKEIVDNTDIFLPNSESEMSRVISDFNIINPLYQVIPNAVDVNLFDPNKVEVDSQFQKYKDCILSVARIEGRKCQLDLVKAVEGTNYKLVLLGKPGANNLGYYNRVRELASENVHFIDHLEHDKLPQFYKLAKVHALISWMETPGLSSIEAGVMGTNIVVTPNGDTYDYFQDYAYYCDPGNISSIRRALDQAFNAPLPLKLRERILDNYTWEKAAEATYKAYRKIVL
ncbi:glycosyl transferase family 1 [Chitinophaga caeni]|uniref:Glycosyl transferase family 1 n=1 Tax=Chitinophaga caeni TaxID=2029983 RepID=A0A291QQS3_9BACT|nr:glycosyltransferase family 4 protein [Chitinophaga caeni]ATL46243.1 glycosyl transferase family 1 [Chitinophaga caeni]